jgi:hypothetical protein
MDLFILVYYREQGDSQADSQVVKVFMYKRLTGRISSCLLF